MTLSGHQVRIELIAAGVPPAAILPFSDALYMPCRAEWLCGDFHRWYFKALAAFGVEEYAAEIGDCDDYADLFAALARIAHHRTPQARQAKAALPIGRIDYSRRPDERHAINWALTSERGVIFPEPQQLFRIEALTALQLLSITRCS